MAKANFIARDNTRVLTRMLELLGVVCGVVLNKIMGPSPIYERACLGLGSSKQISQVA